jgi:hypothetical protein
MVAVSDDRPICATSTAVDATGSQIRPRRGIVLQLRLTRTRPADGDTVGLAQYWVAEAAKRRLIFGLDELELPIKISDGSSGVAFDLLSSTQGKIITGHQRRHHHS